MYISDATGLRYSLSLPSNVRTTTGECEFDRIASLEGIYIANFKSQSSRPAAATAAPLSKKLADDEDEDEDFDDLIDEEDEVRGV